MRTQNVFVCFYICIPYFRPFFQCSLSLSLLLLLLFIVLCTVSESVRSWRDTFVSGLTSTFRCYSHFSQVTFKKNKMCVPFVLCISFPISFSLFFLSLYPTPCRPLSLAERLSEWMSECFSRFSRSVCFLAHKSANSFSTQHVHCSRKWIKWI